jgi:DNA-binding NtrC family response regulator
MDMRADPNRCLLLIDDEPAQRRLVTAIGARAGWWVRGASDFDAAKKMFEDPQEPKFDAILLDHWLPGEAGTELIREIRTTRPDLPLLVLTAQNDVAVAVDAMRAGASDFIVKPLAPDRLLAALNTATDRRKASGELRPLSEKITRTLGFEEIVGSAPKFRTALAIAAKAARARVSVLIEGESGSGKEIVAQAIHAASPRGKKQLHTVNCGAIPENLVESVLFGHEKGAFTGAFDRHVGRFEDADGSTLFLDEVGELPLDTQVKLLRALETGEIQRVGSRTTMTVDVRIIAATNRRLAEEVAAGRFREDLYYRLNVVHVPIPPLRDRQSDIPPLARHLLARIAEQPGMRPLSITDDALAVLMAMSASSRTPCSAPRCFAKAMRSPPPISPTSPPKRPAASAPTIITPSRSTAPRKAPPSPTAPASLCSRRTAICVRSKRSKPTSSASPSAIIAAA